MININELRINNYVDIGKSVYYRIKADDFVNIDFSKVKPIPISMELLLKCGFCENIKGFDFSIVLPNGNNTELSIDFTSESPFAQNCSIVRYRDEILRGGCDFAYVKSIKYVHELQNLYFCLTGKELEVYL